MAITFRELEEIFPLLRNVDVKWGILLRARHGIGKSCLVYQYAKMLNLPVVERRASQMTEGDLLGLPMLKKDTTTWLPPDWLERACKEPVVLFIDEIDRASTEVSQGFFELCDSRKIAGNYLHPDTLIFAAVNSGTNMGAQYQVREMDPAELDRWTVYDLDPTVDEWLSWATKDDNVHPIVREFIRENPTHLEHLGEFEPNKVYPSRRSWHRCSNCLAVNNLLKDATNASKIFNISNSFVGLEAGIAFTDFVKNYDFQVSPEDILAGKTEKTKNFDINQLSRICEAFVEKKIFNKKLNQLQIRNLAEWMKTLPSELAIKLFSDMSISSIEENNIFELHKNAAEYIVEMLRSEDPTATTTTTKE